MQDYNKNLKKLLNNEIEKFTQKTFSEEPELYPICGYKTFFSYINCNGQIIYVKSISPIIKGTKGITWTSIHNSVKTFSRIPFK